MKWSEIFSHKSDFKINVFQMTIHQFYLHDMLICEKSQFIKKKQTNGHKEWRNNFLHQGANNTNFFLQVHHIAKPDEVLKWQNTASQQKHMTKTVLAVWCLKTCEDKILHDKMTKTNFGLNNKITYIWLLFAEQIASENHMILHLWITCKTTNSYIPD